MSSWRRWGWQTVGSLALGLGVLGIFLPLLPTTPFLLLASYCFLRSSPVWHRWLIGHPWLGRYVRDWEEQGGVRRPVKILAVATVLTVVAVSWMSGRLSDWAWLTLVGLATIGLFVVWRLPVANDAPHERTAAETADSPTVELVRGVPTR